MALCNFDVAAGQRGAAQVICFWGVFGIREPFRGEIRQNFCRRGIVALQHGDVPTRTRHQSVGVDAGRNLLQYLSPFSRIAILKHFEVSKTNPGLGGI